jgi:lambda family phage minor tail protein L
MTDLIKDLQKQNPGSAIVELYELELDTDITTNTTAYFHRGLEGDMTTIKFRSDTKGSVSGKYDILEYLAIPMEITGFEIKSGEASARPTLTIANILTNFSDALEGLENEDLLGKKITRRRTLYKYCVGQSGDQGDYIAPIEFSKDIYFIDRISAQFSSMITFELASAFDLEGFKLPRRIVIGGSCPWKYQGADVGIAEGSRTGGCTWNRFSRNDDNTYTNFVNRADEPVIPISFAPTSNYSSGAVAQNYIYRVQKTGLNRIEPNQTILANDDTNNPVYDYWQGTEVVTSANAGTPSDLNRSFRRIRVYKEYNIGEKWVNAYTDKNYSDYVSYIIGSDPNDNRTLETYPRLFRVINQTQIGGDHKPNNSGYPQQGKYWERADICGKSLNSCMQRYQFKPININSNSDKGPAFNRDESKTLMFGGFPSSRKYGR